MMVVSKRRADFTLRSEWFYNLKGFKFEEYKTEVVDVVVAGHTATATVEEIGRSLLMAKDAITVYSQQYLG